MRTFTTILKISVFLFVSLFMASVTILTIENLNGIGNKYLNVLIATTPSIIIIYITAKLLLYAGRDTEESIF